MEEYKPNSHKSKEEQKNLVPEKRVEKVISGTVKSKKKSEMQKFADVFISEDVNNVKSYIVMDVLVPAIKKAILVESCSRRPGTGGALGMEVMVFLEGQAAIIKQHPYTVAANLATRERHHAVGAGLLAMGSTRCNRQTQSFASRASPLPRGA